jgi:hypothetical protein
MIPDPFTLDQSSSWNCLACHQNRGGAVNPIGHTCGQQAPRIERQAAEIAVDWSQYEGRPALSFGPYTPPPVPLPPMPPYRRHGPPPESFSAAQRRLVDAVLQGMQDTIARPHTLRLQQLYLDRLSDRQLGVLVGVTDPWRQKRNAGWGIADIRDAVLHSPGAAELRGNSVGRDHPRRAENGGAD